MTPKLPCHRPAPGRGLLPSIAAATVLAGALICAMPAQAGLVITSTAREVVAQSTAALPVFEPAPNDSGSFDTSAIIQVVGGPFDGALVSAAQDSLIGPLTFSGSGQSTLDLRDGVAGFAESRFVLFFTLTSHFNFTGDVLLSTSGNAESNATFALDALDLGGGSILSGDESNALPPFSGTLGPGHYSLRVIATSTGFTADESGDAAFSFNLAFVDLGDPPAAVPEPQALALVFLGLLACAGVRRRR